MHFQQSCTISWNYFILLYMCYAAVFICACWCGVLPISLCTRDTIGHYHTATIGSKYMQYVYLNNSTYLFIYYHYMQLPLWMKIQIMFLYQVHSYRGYAVDTCSLPYVYVEIMYFGTQRQLYIVPAAPLKLIVHTLVCI